MQGFDFGDNNKTGSQSRNSEHEAQSNYEHDLLQEEHHDTKSTKSVHNGLVDYTI